MARSTAYLVWQLIALFITQAKPREAGRQRALQDEKLAAEAGAHERRQLPGRCWQAQLPDLVAKPQLLQLLQARQMRCNGAVQSALRLRVDGKAAQRTGVHEGYHTALEICL